MLTVADRGEGGDKICQNLADVICERSLSELLCLESSTIMLRYSDLYVKNGTTVSQTIKQNQTIY